MDQNKFWNLITQTREGLNAVDNAGNMSLQAEKLSQILSGLSKKELTDFSRIFIELLNKAYRWDLWGAAYVIGGGCSDDSFMDFRSWLISMGKDVYEIGLKSPDELAAPAIDPTVEDCFFEEFLYVADQVFEEKFNEEMDLEMDYPDEPSGKPWEEDELKSMFPKLSRQFDF